MLPPKTLHLRRSASVVNGFVGSLLGAPGRSFGLRHSRACQLRDLYTYKTVYDGSG
jgi:hypothetical protein